MQQILPIVTVCSTLLAVCLGYLVYQFVRYCRAKKASRCEQYVYQDEEVLTIDLDKL